MQLVELSYRGFTDVDQVQISTPVTTQQYIAGCIVPKQHADRRYIDESAHRFPRGRLVNEDDTIVAPTGKVVAVWGELEDSDSVRVVR